MIDSESLTPSAEQYLMLLFDYSRRRQHFTETSENDEIPKIVYARKIEPINF